MGWRGGERSAGVQRDKPGAKCRQDLRLEQCLSRKPGETRTVLGMRHYVLALFVCHAKGSCGLSPLQAGRHMRPYCCCVLTARWAGSELSSVTCWHLLVLFPVIYPPTHDPTSRKH